MGAFFRSMLVVGVVGGALACSACSKKAPAPAALAPTPTNLPPAAAAAAKAVGGDGKLDPNDPAHGTRRRMGLDTPVYVDGVQVAVLRSGEMPPIPFRPVGTSSRRYKLHDYLTAIGVDVAAVRSVHFHGNMDRIGAVEGSELRNEKDRFEFSFLGGSTGVPVQQWSVTGLKNEFVFHEIRRMSIYVKKPSARLKADKNCHVGANGACTSDIPYADGILAKGTRVYLDGKMIGFVKQRNVGDDVVVTPSDDPEATTYSLAKLVERMGADLATVKHVELAAGDDIVARASDYDLATVAQMTFTLPRHNHGKVRVHVPGQLQARQEGDVPPARDGLVSAVLLYKSATPTPGRELVAISEETNLSVQLAAIDDARAALGRQQGAN